jgi:hypothetical protein
MPVSDSLGDIPKSISEFRELLKRAGRNPDVFDITVIVLGLPDMDHLMMLRDLGVKRAIIGIHHEYWDKPDLLRGMIDNFAKCIPQLA